jgi:hypothetical protein
MPNRNIHPTRYLPAVPAYEQPAQVRGLTPAETRTLAQILSSAPTHSLDQQAFASQPGAAERTSGVDRAQALVIRLLPFTFVWAILATAIAIQFQWAMPGALLLFAGLTGFTYYQMDTAERYDSKHGVEHHRIDAATYLAEQRMRQEQELRRMALAATLQQLEVRNGRDY